MKSTKLMTAGAKKRIKRAIAVMLCLSMVFTFIPTATVADSAGGGAESEPTGSGSITVQYSDTLSQTDLGLPGAVVAEIQTEAEDKRATLYEGTDFNWNIIAKGKTEFPAVGAYTAQAVLIGASEYAQVVVSPLPTYEITVTGGVILP
jgi:hypothetical protein